MLRRTIKLGVGCSLAALLAACTVVNETVDNVAENTIDDSSGSTGMGMGMGTSMHEMSMQMFRGMFYQGGYALETRPFEPGEYVQWQVDGMGDAEWFKKALLKRRADGNEWWRLVSQTSGNRITMEALLEPADESGDRRIVRLRQKLGPDQEAKEVPITEENADKWTLDQQRQLTEESYQGMKVGTESITVPAGTFDADHLRSTHPRRGGTVDWYLSEEVPGSVIRYTWTSNGNEQSMALADTGSGMTSSKLGAF